MGRPKLKEIRYCYRCGSNKTYIDKRGCINWFRHREISNAWLCEKCYHNLYITPRISTYKNSQVINKERPLTGYCTWCQNNIYNGSCSITHMAHMEYDDEYPLENRIELCNKCHKFYDLLIARLKNPKKCITCGGDTYLLHIKGRTPYKKWAKTENGYQCMKCNTRSMRRIDRMIKELIHMEFY